MSTVEYFWTFQLIDPDGDDHITSEIKPWLCWRTAGKPMRVFITNAVVEEFNNKNDSWLTAEQIVFVRDQIIDFFTEDVKPGRENQINVRYDPEDENEYQETLDLQVWTLSLQQ